MTSKKSVILTCSCFNMNKKAAEAFCLLYPNEVLPEIVRGRDRIYKLSQQIHNEHIKAISKLTGRFAYYIELDKDNHITKEVNLINGAKVA